MKKLVSVCLVSMMFLLIACACQTTHSGMVQEPSPPLGKKFDSAAFRENVGFILRGEFIYAVAGIRVEILGETPIWYRTLVRMSPEDMLQKGPDDPEVLKAIENATDILEEAVKRSLPGTPIEMISPKDGSWIPLGTTALGVELLLFEILPNTIGTEVEYPYC